MSGNTTSVQWRKHVPLLGVLLLLFSAGPYISRVPWYDEVLTLNWLVYPFSQIPFRYTIPNNHIFYTMCLSLWESLMGMFGVYGTLILRILSLIFGVCAVWIIARRMRRIHSVFAQISLLILFAGGCTMNLFSTALRGYMPAMLFCFSAFLMAERWMKMNQKRTFFFYLIFCYCSVLTIPTNLLSIGGGLLFLLPLGLRSGKDFFRLFVLGTGALFAFVCAYLPIFRKFLRVAAIKEGWYSYADFSWNYYGTLCFLFFPLLLFCFAGTVQMFRKRPLRFRAFSFCGVFLIPLILGLLFQVAPFPRVFVPLFPIFVLILCYELSFFLRRKHGMLQKLPLLLSVIWLLLMPHISGSVSKWMFQEHYRDDLLMPYPMTISFQPQRTAGILAEAYKTSRIEYVFIDFDADPPSLEYQLLGYDVPQNIVLKDRPDRGPVQQLSPGVWIVCRDDITFQRVKKRFDLKGNYRILPETLHLYQKIYVPE